jgi:hypothetical protein
MRHNAHAEAVEMAADGGTLIARINANWGRGFFNHRWTQINTDGERAGKRRFAEPETGAMENAKTVVRATLASVLHEHPLFKMRRKANEFEKIQVNPTESN